MTLLNVSTKVFAVSLTFEIVFISLLILMPRLGKLGKIIFEAFTRAPWLDFVVLMLVPIPWLIGSLVAGLVGFYSYFSRTNYGNADLGFLPRTKSP